MDKESLKRIIFDQHNIQFKPTDIKRFSELHEDNQVVVLSGVRRCGKSTFLLELRQKLKESDYYLNFDDDRLVNFTIYDFQLLYETFIELYGEQKTFYFDEIQNIKGWERFVRRLHDYGNKIYITGSNASMLSRELGTHLTGRYYQNELFPFSFKEFLQIRKHKYNKQIIYKTKGKSELKAMFNEYFLKGGFPEYLQSGNKQYLTSLYENILYRDVMVRNGLTNEKELLELVHFIASNISKLISYNSLTKVIGVKNATTVKNYLSYLQNTYLLFLINKYDVSVKKQIQNPKKVYFIDVGLVRELGFYYNEDNGRLLENIVFIELKRRAKEIYYHNRKKECDFVIKEKNKIVEAIQVSWSIYNDETRKREIEGLIDALKTYNLNKGLILTESDEEQLVVENYNIEIKPVWKWLLQL